MYNNNSYTNYYRKRLYAGYLIPPQPPPVLKKGQPIPETGIIHALYLYRLYIIFCFFRSSSCGML